VALAESLGLEVSFGVLSSLLTFVLGFLLLGFGVPLGRGPRE
jgi:hypothetical protein